MKKSINNIICITVLHNTIYINYINRKYEVFVYTYDLFENTEQKRYSFNHFINDKKLPLLIYKEDIKLLKKYRWL